MPVMSSFRPGFDPRGAGREALDHVRKGQEIREEYDKKKREREARKYLEENPGAPRPEDIYHEEALPTSEAPRARAPGGDSALPDETAYSSTSRKEKVRRDPAVASAPSHVGPSYDAAVDAAPSHVGPDPTPTPTPARTQPVAGAPPAEGADDEAVPTTRVMDREKWDRGWAERQQALYDAGRDDEAKAVPAEKVAAEFAVAESILANNRQGIEADDPVAIKKTIDQIGQLNPLFQETADAVQLDDDGTLTMSGEPFTKDHLYAAMMNMSQYRQLATEQAELDMARADVSAKRTSTETNKKQGRYYDALAERLRAESQALITGTAGGSRGRASANSVPEPEVRDEVQRLIDNGTYTDAAAQFLEELGKNKNELGMQFQTPQDVHDSMVGMTAQLLRAGGSPELIGEELSGTVKALQRWRMGLGTAEELGIEFKGVGTAEDLGVPGDPANPDAKYLSFAVHNGPDLRLPVSDPLAITLTRTQAQLSSMQTPATGEDPSAIDVATDVTSNVKGFLSDRDSWKHMAGALPSIVPQGAVESGIDYIADNVAPPVASAINEHGASVWDALTASPAELAAWGIEGASNLPSWALDVLRTIDTDRQNSRANYEGADVQLGRGIDVPESDAERRQREAREAGERRKARNVQAGG